MSELDSVYVGVPRRRPRQDRGSPLSEQGLRFGTLRPGATKLFKTDGGVQTEQMGELSFKLVILP
jgi:hypothetical protein